MFENLDQIDWNNLGRHIWASNDKIPESIRNLLSIDPDVRQKAREFLIGPDRDWQYVADTTSHVIPFILELLGNPDTPDRDALLLDLANIAENIWDSPKASVHQMRRYVETYDALETGMNIFTRLLDDPSTSVRTSTVNLLKWLTSEFETLLSEFLRRFRVETEEDVQITLLMGMKALLNPIVWPRWDYSFHQNLKEKHRLILGEIIETHPAPQVQLAAAKASVEVFSRLEDRREYASPKVPTLLSEEFLAKSAPLDFSDIHSTWEPDLREVIVLMKDLLRLNADVLLKLLREPTINAIQAHILFSGLLSNTMGLDYFGPTWDDVPHLDYRKKHDGIYYVNNYSSALNLQSIVNHELNHPELNFVRPTLPVIRAIVDHDVFWETPTNMFSFFFGLPDSREEWRKMLEARSIH